MGSSVKHAALSDDGVTVTTDYSKLTLKESVGERHFW